jgi:dihydrofolate reductase
MTHHERAVPTGALVHFVSGDVDEVHAKALSIAGDLDIWMMGGGDVAAQFMQHELIDEFIITIMPVILGSGRPLCPGAAITDPLTLRDVHRFESGAIELTYAR